MEIDFGAMFGPGDGGYTDLSGMGPADSGSPRPSAFTGHEYQMADFNPSRPRPVGGGGGGGGGGSADHFGAQHQLNIAQLQEQQRQFNVGQQAQQESAKTAATGITNLVNEYNKAYATSIQEYEGRYQQMLGLAESTSGQQAADIRSQYGRQAASGMQNLQRLGMGNTTVSQNIKTGIQNQESSALNRLSDQLLQQKLGIMGGKKTARELAPDSTLLSGATQAGISSAGVYGGAIAGALGGAPFVAGTPYQNISPVDMPTGGPLAGPMYSSPSPSRNDPFQMRGMG